MAVAVKDIELTSDELEIACRRSLYHFGLHILGYNWLTDCHRDMVEEVTRCKRTCLLAPRFHLKTTLFSVVYPLWLLSDDPGLQFLFGSESGTKAARILGEIREHLDNNNLLRWYAPELVRRYENARYDRRPEFKFAPDPSEGPPSKDPTAVALGVGATATSGHSDVAICDDLNTIDDKYSEATRRAKWEWFAELDNVVAPGGMILNIQTRWHQGDIAGRIMKLHPEYRIIIYDVYGNKQVREPYADPDDWELDYIGRDGLMFPERFHVGRGEITAEDGGAKKGLADLMRDTINWSAQYLNKPIAQEYALFKEEWFVPKRPPGKLDIEYIVVGIDWAYSESKSAADTAFVAFGVTDNTDMWLLDAWAGTCTDDHGKALVAFTERVYRRWDQLPAVYYAEANGPQLGITNIVARETGLPFEHVPDLTEHKHARAESQASYWNRGVVHVAEGCGYLAEVREQYLNFPSSSKCDLVDAGGNAIIPTFYGFVGEGEVAAGADYSADFKRMGGY